MQLEGHISDRRNFGSSIFACATMNFGPSVRCFRHRDSANLPFGWCAITALGDFDHKRGGHLILWDAKLVLEFPHASTILIPSATLIHSNIGTQPNEWRASFTQFTAGGNFRWVDNGFQTEHQLCQRDYGKYLDMVRRKQGRWEMGLTLYSAMGELLQTV
jgi:hypothetical protein